MGVIDYIGDNATQIDAEEYEAKVREKDPSLLQHDERLAFAFKGRGGSGRDHYMLTTKRVLLRDRKGVTGKRVRYVPVLPNRGAARYATLDCIILNEHHNAPLLIHSYTSVPYGAVRAFSLETAGTVDDDQELKLYSRSIGKVSIDLVKSVDILPIHRFLSAAVIRGTAAGEEAAGAIAHDGGAVMSGGKSGIFDVVGSNYALTIQNPSQKQN